MLSRDVGIIGYGSAAYHKKPQRTMFGYIGEAARNAVANAGLAKDEIDGLSVDASMGSDTSVSAAEYLGLSVSWAARSTAAGAGTLMAVANAVRAVDAGLARCVLCIGAGAQDISIFKKRISSFTAAVSDYLAPHGYGGPPGMHAIIQRKHMERYGTTREQLGRIAVDQRANARLNEAALLRGPMTLDDYLNAKLVADPLRLYDCVMPCSGAEAVVIGPLERAPAGKGVRVAAARERHNHPVGEIAPVRGGWELFRDVLFDEAGYSQKDMHFMQCYDDFPIMAAIQIEDLGFCAKGEVGRFLDENRLTHDGSFPLNTGGGQLSCGQAGGGAGLLSVVEATRQLRGEGGARQVPDAARGVVSGFGMISYGHGLAASALVLEKA
ncbi:MAG TPA: thiolase family protein [Burkholderiales bacterium]|nr:thiolase family protein [Burkholderiales bacterium]